MYADMKKVKRISRDIQKFLVKSALDLDGKARVINYWRAIKIGGKCDKENSR